MRTALRAVFHASVETQQLLLMAGLSVALVTMVAAAVAAMALVLAQRVSWGRRDPDSPAAARLSWVTVCALAATLLALGSGTQALSSLFAGLAHEGIAVLPDLGGAGISSVFGGESTALHVEETLTASVMSARAAVQSWLNVSIVAGYVAMILSLGSILTNLVRDVRASGIRVVVTSTQA
ncbi:MAG: hypothetical protein QGG40_13020 [Myxococcota bacterium]|nr:hypothetical protein [Myxococcota bacterium]